MATWTGDTESGIATMKVKKVTRKGRKVNQRTANEIVTFSCGHFCVMKFEETEGETASIIKQWNDESEKVCPWCRIVALGGKAFAGQEPSRWKLVV